ncbi:MAG: TCP-1/cpn60 chaperonin family protein [Candidatus Thermoplasmatota archaeon]|nr:TCP-1/cpn60 chaperonin family protein [Candidatus Thermoplasmatota archaeon]
MVNISDVKEANKATIIMHGVSFKNQPIMENEIKKTVKNTLNALNTGAIPGDGLVYLLIANEIKKESFKVKTKEALAMTALAEVMEEMYKTLAENQGKNGIDEYLKARNMFTKNKTLDNIKNSMPYEVFTDQLKRSLETTTHLLRIDEIISAKPLYAGSKASGGIVIYTSDGCPYCQKTKEYLRSRGIYFKEKNVSRDPSAVMEMQSVSDQTGTPVTVIKGTPVVGFDQARLDSLL